MTHVSTPTKATAEEAERLEFEAELNASADKVFGVIQEARGKMTDQERARADRNAAAILKTATETAKPARRRA
jgi:uncharacterized protein YjbJ (UPF0337 family)